MKRYLSKDTLGENESLAGILKNEAQRYRDKGFVNTVLGFLMFFAYFYICPIFLKAIWPLIVSIGSQQVIIVILITMVPLGILTVGNLIFWNIYVSKYPFFEKYRITKDLWPWEKDYKQWRALLHKSIVRILFNTFVFQLPLTALYAYIVGINRYKWTAESFPEHTEMIWHFCIMFVCEDIAGYAGHRLMHHPFFYSRFHKVHHEHANTVTIAATYAHPVEFVATNTPAIFGFALLGSKTHFATLLMWIIFRMLETIEAHSGYEFPWTPIKVLPFSCSGEYHSYHHSHNLGVYGSFFSFCDTIGKTNNDFFMYKARMDQIKHNQQREAVKEKSS